MFHGDSRPPNIIILTFVEAETEIEEESVDFARFSIYSSPPDLWRRNLRHSLAPATVCGPDPVD